MSDEHLEKTLSELLAQRQQKISELNKLDSAIEAIQRLRGVQGSESSFKVDIREPGGVAVVKPGDFFGRSATDSAHEYLKRRGSAASLDEIVSALEKGGARLEGKNPKKNLYISLIKKRAIFVSVAPYTFGLWEFYPDATGRKVGGDLIMERLKEVMQDG